MITRPCRTCGRSFRPVAKARYCSTECRCGTDAGYNAGCKCTRCLAAHAKARNLSRLHANPRVPVVGVQRRVQALACLGWSYAEISRRLGMDRTYLSKALLRSTVEPATAAAVAALYDELSMTTCTSATASRTAAAARSHGYAPPLAWDEGTLDDPTARPYGYAGRQARAASDVDEVVIDRFLAGEYRVPTTRAERIEIARRWHGAGRSLADLERVTGWNVARYFRITDQAEAA